MAYVECGRGEDVVGLVGTAEDEADDGGGRREKREGEGAMKDRY